VHKGQGRAILEGRTMTVVPGMSVVAPPCTWHGLRNTGTGDLHIAWLASPPGVEVFFRELSRLSGSADAATIQAIAQRYGVEFRPDEELAQAAVPVSRHRRRRHRGGERRLTKPREVPAIGQPLSPSSLGPTRAGVEGGVAPTASSQVSSPTVAPSVGAHRRHRRPRGRSRDSSGPHSPSQRATQPLPPPPTSPTAPHREPQETSAATPHGSRQPSPSRHAPRRGHPQRRGHMKEVYMGGRWVQVSGEGPVISPGHERSTQPPKSSRRDDDTPRGPLSVPL